MRQRSFASSTRRSRRVPVRGANTDAREARDQEVGAPLAPGDHLPGLGRKRKRETLDGLRLVVGVADHAARRAPTPGPGPDRRRRVGARPHGGVRLDAGDVSKTEPRKRRTQAPQPASIRTTPGGAVLPSDAHRVLALFGKLVSSMIQASIGSLAVIEGSVSSRTFARTLASDQGDWATKCSSDWCCAETREGAVTAASGSTLLRSAGVR